MPGTAQGLTQDYSVLRFAKFHFERKDSNAGRWKGLPASRMSILSGTHLVIANDKQGSVHESIALNNAKQYLSARFNDKSIAFLYRSPSRRCKFKVELCAANEVSRAVGDLSQYFTIAPISAKKPTAPSSAASQMVEQAATPQPTASQVQVSPADEDACTQPIADLSKSTQQKKTAVQGSQFRGNPSMSTAPAAATTAELSLAPSQPQPRIEPGALSKEERQAMLKADWAFLETVDIADTKVGVLLATLEEPSL